MLARLRAMSGPMEMKSLLFAAALVCGLPQYAIAQGQDGTNNGPLRSAVPAAVDAAWPGGTITIDIDASDVQRGIYRVRQTIPLAPGTRRLTLLLPEWLPGNHAPRGPIAELAGLRLAADGQPVGWTRDPLEVHAFHVDLPAGARELTAEFIHTSPLQSAQGRVTMTPEMLNLQWEKMTLYPAGHYVSRIRVKPAVTLPAGWEAATALGGKTSSGDRVRWAETDYETLVDSPIFAGRYFRHWDLGKSVSVDAVADSPDLLALRTDGQGRLVALVDEAMALFGRPPYDEYDFLIALSDKLGGIGLEHLKSSENQLEPRNFIEWSEHDWDRNVLAHELAHAWNGKYRRPARLWTPDYRTPMQDDLLWVYEGQTQFWGWVLAARSGLQRKEIVLGMIASRAGYYASQPGREWRAVGDTTLDPIIAARKSKPYPSLARREDYYNEGALVWLEADQIIRQGTGGAKGLDDFARVFFSHPGDGSRVRTYERAELIAALQSVHVHDWEGFFRQRIDSAGLPPPLTGIEMAGYRLVWKAQPNPYDKARMDKAGELNLYHSLGLTIDKDGNVVDSRWDSPAFRAGIVTGARIVAVDGIAYSTNVISQAIARAAAERRAIELLVRRGDRFESMPVDYRGGLRWPWLEPADGGASSGLDRLLAPRRESPSP